MSRCLDGRAAPAENQQQACYKVQGSGQLSALIAEGSMIGSAAEGTVPMAFRLFGLLAAASLLLWAGGPAWAAPRDASPLRGPMTEPPIILAQGGCKNVEAYNACAAPKLLNCNNAKYSQEVHDRCTAAASEACKLACTAR
jgi:hypothetical protein